MKNKYFLLLVLERKFKIAAPVRELAACAAAPPLPPRMSMVLHGKFDCESRCFAPELFSDDELLCCLFSFISISGATNFSNIAGYTWSGQVYAIDTKTSPRSPSLHGVVEPTDFIQKTGLGYPPHLLALLLVTIHNDLISWN